METEGIFTLLHHESEEIITGMRDWGTAHPKATFAQIEAAVDERLNRLRARMVQEIALASQAGDGAALAPIERPRCPTCEECMAPRGEQEREVTVQGDHTVHLTRSYWVCPSCGTGLFPPG